MTTKPQMRGETKGQARLRRRQEGYRPTKDGSTRKPGSVKKASPEGRRERRERTGGLHLAKRNR
jgi:hypothetical protein